MSKTTIVILATLNLTRSLRIEKIAILDRDANMIDDVLPKNKYGTYYRVIANDHEIEASLMDSSYYGITATVEDFLKFKNH